MSIPIYRPKPSRCIIGKLVATLTKPDIEALKSWTDAGATVTDLQTMFTDGGFRVATWSLRNHCRSDCVCDPDTDLLHGSTAKN